MLSISIVIPTMNRLESLKRTISHIVSGNVLPQEIIIVDQTQDETIIEATQAFLKKQCIKCIYLHQEQPSLTKARNYGTDWVSSDLVIQMDDDVDICINTLSTIIDIFSNNNVAMLAGINEGYNSKPQSFLGYLFWKKNWFKRKIGHVTLSMYGRFPTHIDSITDTEWAMGFFSVYRTFLIRKWNLKWDEHLINYAYPEDLDFSYSYYKYAKQEGFKCVMSNRVIVKHNVTQEWRIPSQKHTRMIILNREYLRYKHHGNNFISKLATEWADYGEFLRRYLKHEAPNDLREAVKEKKTRIKEIRKGNIFC